MGCQRRPAGKGLWLGKTLGVQEKNSVIFEGKGRGLGILLVAERILLAGIIQADYQGGSFKLDEWSWMGAGRDAKHGTLQLWGTAVS